MSYELNLASKGRIRKIYGKGAASDPVWLEMGVFGFAYFGNFQCAGKEPPCMRLIEVRLFPSSLEKSAKSTPWKIGF